MQGSCPERFCVLPKQCAFIRGLRIWGLCVVLPLGFRLTKAENGLRRVMKLHRVHEGQEIKVCGNVWRKGPSGDTTSTAALCRC